MTPMNRTEKQIAAGVVIFSIIIIYLITNEVIECNNAGGILVRGVFWFECMR